LKSYEWIEAVGDFSFLWREKEKVLPSCFRFDLDGVEKSRVT
jgi:hypothetical protein